MILKKNLAFFCCVYVFLSICMNEVKVQCTELYHMSVGEREQALISKLLKNYSKKQKPTGTTEVKFALNLNQIIAVKAKDQVFMLNAFLDHEWVDSRLSWGIE